MLKAIETRYKGYRFRSRLEARWAVFFDVLGVKYEYEPQGFDLHEAGAYLPDFWLPDINSFFEVKGVYSDDLFPLNRTNKQHALCRYSGKCVHVFVGNEFSNINVPLTSKFSYMSYFAGFASVTNASWIFNYSTKIPSLETGHKGWSLMYATDASEIIHARYAACGARFEHGEQP